MVRLRHNLINFCNRRPDIIILGFSGLTHNALQLTLGIIAGFSRLSTTLFLFVTDRFAMEFLMVIHNRRVFRISLLHANPHGRLESINRFNIKII